MKRIWILFLVVMMVLCGCSKGNTSNESASEMSYTGDGEMKGEYGIMDMAEGGYETMDASEEVSEDSESADPETDSKIIRTVYLTMETLDFDKLTGTIRSQAAAYNGYVESSSISNNSYYSSDTRYGYFVVRIPADQADSFMKSLGDQGTVVSQSENMEDVTLQYVDTEGHIKVLRSEQERLLELLEQAETVDEILQIEEHLTNVRYELESYESKLNILDHQIDYTTITIDVNEVQQITTPEEATMWQKMKDGFKDSVSGIGNGIQTLIIFMVAKIPYILILAAVITLLVVSVKKHKKKK